MKTRIKLPSLYPKQKAALLSGKRYTVIEASTKAGKTLGALVVLIAWGFRAKTDAYPFRWIAPSIMQARMAFERVRTMLPRELFTSNESLREITLINGVVLQFLTGEKPDLLYGEDCAGAILDEYTRMREAAWHAVRSTLTATKGPAIFIGNVRGRGWGFKLARRAESGAHENWHYAKLTAYDAVDGGVLDIEEVEAAKRELPDHVFRELYLAEPLDDGSNPFGYRVIERQTVALTGKPVVAWGLDVGRFIDATALVGLDAQRKPAEHHRWVGVPWVQQIDEIARIVRSDRCLMDATGAGRPAFELLFERCPGVEPFTFTAASKQALCEAYVYAAQSGNAWFAEGEMRRQAEVWTYEYKPGRGIRYTHPDGDHDDDIIAGALADKLATDLGYPQAPGFDSADSVEQRYAARSRLQGLI